MVNTLKGIFAKREEKLKFKENRCVYENEDILVMHSIGHFPDGTKVAIMGSYIIKWQNCKDREGCDTY